MEFEYDLSEIEGRIDSIVSHAMYDKRYICYHEYGMIKCPYCTDYQLVKDAVHYAIKCLVDYKASEKYCRTNYDSAEFSFKCMDFYPLVQGGNYPYYYQIGYKKDPIIDKIYEGCRFEVETLIKQKMKEYDERNKPFKIKVSKVKNKEKVIKL